MIDDGEATTAGNLRGRRAEALRRLWGLTDDDVLNLRRLKVSLLADWRLTDDGRGRIPATGKQCLVCVSLGDWKSPTGSLEDFLAAAVEAAKQAGEIIRSGFYGTKLVEHKGEIDLVTETDKKCEELVFNLLKQQYPDHQFIGEETAAACGTIDLTDEPTWIIDPVDGTTNFVHGYPIACVSIGLTIRRIPTVGVVYNPIMDELFTAIRGKGAFLNGKSIRVSSQEELVKSLLAAEVVASHEKSVVDASTNTINSLLFKVRSLRMNGSCALDLCWIACGRIDLFYLVGFGGPWDVAAGAVIVTEAGGVVFDPSGKDFDVTAQRVAASNPLLKDAFVEAYVGMRRNTDAPD